MGWAHAEFRARAGAAPLKQSGQSITATPSIEFRARAGAAPLKLLCPCVAAGKSVEIPRPRGRGPVEAAPSPSPMRGHQTNSAPARARPR